MRTRTLFSPPAQLQPLSAPPTQATALRTCPRPIRRRLLRLAQVQLAIAEIDARRVNLAHEFENAISPEAVQLMVAQQLPALASAPPE